MVLKTEVSVVVVLVLGSDSSCASCGSEVGGSSGDDGGVARY